MLMFTKRSKNKHMTKQIPTPQALLGNISRTDAYLEETETNGVPRSELTRDEAVQLRARAIGGGALHLMRERTTESGYTDTEGQLYGLIATLEPFLNASLNKEEAKAEGTYKRHEHLDDVAKTIDFTSTLHDIIDNNPRISPNQLKSFIEQAFILSYGSKDVEYLMQQVDSSVRGIQHEIGFKQILEQIPGVSYTESSRDEELKSAVDLYVQYKGLTIPLDVKNSKKAAISMNDERLGTNGNTTYKIWSNVLTTDFNDTFRIPQSLAISKADDVKRELLYAMRFNYKEAI